MIKCRKWSVGIEHEQGPSSPPQNYIKYSLLPSSSKKRLNLVSQAEASEFTMAQKIQQQRRREENSKQHTNLLSVGKQHHDELWWVKRM